MKNTILVNKKAIILLLLSLPFTGMRSLAQHTVSKADDQSYSLVLTPKLHSAGHFPYSGSYINRNLNAELGLSYEGSMIGGFISKNIDLVDAHSSLNYATVGLFKSINLNRSIVLTPYLGYFFGQANSLMDTGSDSWAAVVVKFTVNKWFLIENTSLVSNLLQHAAGTSLANRLNVRVTIKGFRFDSFTWYSHVFKQEPHFVSGGFSITTPDWKINDNISVKTQVAMLQQLSLEKPASAKKRGLVVSLIVPIELKKR